MKGKKGTKCHVKCLVEKREFEIEFPVEEKKENEFKIECLLNHILGGRKKKRMGSDAGKKRKRS